MDIVVFMIDLILHIDQHLLAFVNNHGAGGSQRSPSIKQRKRP